MRAVLWVPGKFSLTNKMLDNLRAGSRYQGARPPCGWVNMFEQETAAIRLAVKTAARREAADVVSAGPCRVGFVVFGHHKHDRDAWYLLGKAALDGLVDAGVFTSDRFGVESTHGWVLRNSTEEANARCALDDVVPEGRPGLAIELRWGDL